MYFFVKQKTAFDMHISDWSSDVGSSDLRLLRPVRISSASRRQAQAGGACDAADHLRAALYDLRQVRRSRANHGQTAVRAHRRHLDALFAGFQPDRKSVVYGTIVACREDTGGRRTIKKKTKKYKTR